MNLKKERNEIEKSKKDTTYQYPIPPALRKCDQAEKPKKEKRRINKRKRNQNEIERRK